MAIPTGYLSKEFDMVALHLSSGYATNGLEQLNAGAQWTRMAWKELVDVYIAGDGSSTDWVLAASRLDSVAGRQAGQPRMAPNWRGYLTSYMYSGIMQQH